jgi:hypothetical protein
MNGIIAKMPPPKTKNTTSSETSEVHFLSIAIAIKLVMIMKINILLRLIRYSFSVAALSAML